jgi:MYXO-CTERM domain-containing protein
MKTRSRKNRALTIPTSRWLAYAGAGAATALAGASSVEAEIHYSGRVNVEFPPDEYKSVTFALDQPGDSIFFVRGQESADFFGVRCPKSGAFIGSDGSGFEYYFVFRIRNQNRYISAGPFSAAGLGNFGAFGTMIKGDRGSLDWRWNRRATGFVGFRFNNGAGNQYGWARVRMDGPDSNFSFTVLDYAWADLGESIKPGQTSSSANSDVTEESSLGLLAAGAAGVALWRQRRRR